MSKWLMGCAVLTCAFSIAASVALTQGQATTRSAIAPARLARHIAALASDEFEGRAPGSPGERRAVDYIIAEMKAAGLQPGPGGWEQEVPLVSSTVINRPPLTLRTPAGQRVYAFGKDYVAWSKRVQPEATVEDAELVFVGYGVVAPEKDWNDYAGVDMRGKVALILVNDPDLEAEAGSAVSGLFGGRAMTWYGRWPYKFEEAARQGAVGALIVHEEAPAGYAYSVVATTFTGPQFDMLRPDRGASRAAFEGWVSQAAAQDMLAKAGLDLDELKAAARSKEFKPRPLGLDVSVSLVQEVREAMTRNVIGQAPGRRHPNDVILYTAHYDHLGRCQPVAGDDICNGAVDNASGVAGILEIARRTVMAGPTNRTVAFVAFAAEEQGHLGSAYYAANPAFPPSSTVAAINVDTMSTYGPARDVTIVGQGKSQLETLFAEAVQRAGRRLSPERAPEAGGYYRSDHLNLAKIGIPSLYTSAGLDLLNGGATRGRELAQRYVAERYHRPSDEFDSGWDLNGAAQDADLLFEVGIALANCTAWPEWNDGSEFLAARRVSLLDAAADPGRRVNCRWEEFADDEEDQAAPVG